MKSQRQFFVSFFIFRYLTFAILKHADENNGILAFNGQKQFVMEEKDQLGRAHSAHIQLQDKDEVKE